MSLHDLFQKEEKKALYCLDKRRIYNNRHEPESNPRGNVNIIARYQGLDEVSRWLLPRTGGFAPVMPGVIRLSVGGSPKQHIWWFVAYY